MPHEVDYIVASDFCRKQPLPETRVSLLITYFLYTIFAGKQKPITAKTLYLLAQETLIASMKHLVPGNK